MTTHSSPTIPEAASKKSSLKDTLFLSRAESEWMEERGGGVIALRAVPRPQPVKDSRSVDREGELGQRKIPGLHLSGWGSSVQHKEGKYRQ